ncbi:MAG: MerR family transcriptional regulator [Alphaproteobacteria bacterium]|nr:MerR family transcriptional regulator [Alphaproteobacteria bacterium]MBF0129766.1 MerR family transcriptional regulator [Alphaproteobacteria bacterium]
MTGRDEDASSPVRERRGGKSDSAFRTIGEVVDELDIPQHVLRFWETKFVHVRPLKRAGGRRYYRPEDVALLRRIRDLLYNDGFTIKGVQKLLRENGPKALAAGEMGSDQIVLDLSPTSDGTGEDIPDAPPPFQEKEGLERLLREMLEMRAELSAVLGGDAPRSSHSTAQS